MRTTVVAVVVAFTCITPCLGAAQPDKAPAGKPAPWKRHVIDDSSRGADGVRLADVNGDGLMDIATGWEEGGVIRAYLNPGPDKAARPWPAVTVGKVKSAEDAVFADLDGDGAFDVVSCCEGGTKTVFFHWAPADKKRYLDPDAWSTTPLPVTARKQSWMFALPMQLDGQHGIDLVVSSKGKNASIGLLLAPAKARDVKAWTFRPIYKAGWIMSLMAVDMDGDGDPDVLATDRKGNNRAAFWLENPGPDAAAEGKWNRHVIADPARDDRAGQYMFLNVGDVDGDGLQDVVVAVKPRTLQWFRRLDKTGRTWQRQHIVVILNGVCYNTPILVSHSGFDRDSMVNSMKKKARPVKKDAGSRMAFSYIRFSRPEQIRGDSVRRQLEATQLYCDRNGLILDETLNLRDLGISAFRGKNVTQGALSAFIEAVESGKIAHGSTLIVESLDRLSRDQLGRAQTLILGILEQGITIVTLSPEREYPPDAANNLGAAIEIIVTLYRAHEESATKSRRVGAAWATKRKRIHEQKLTGQCPSWLELSDDRTEFHVVPEAVETVRRIFQMATDGYGVDAIARKLNAESVPPIARAQTWHRSYVLKILKNRSVLGEFQPHNLTSGKRQPVGDPIPSYYPKIIDEELFYRAQNGMASRKIKRGRRGTEVSNLFTGLLRNTVDGSSMVLLNKGSGPKGGKRLISSAALRGENGAHRASIRYEPFELQMLTWLGGLDEAAVISAPDTASGRKELATVDGMLVDTKDRIAKVQARMVNGPSDEFDNLLDVLEQLKRRAGELQAQREELQAKIHGSQAGTFQAYRTAWQRMTEAPDDQRERVRSRLRAGIAAMVDRFDVTIEPDGMLRHVLVEVYLKGVSDAWYVYFVTRGLQSAWLSIGGGKEEIDLQTLKDKRYAPFKWKSIPKAGETDLACPAPIVRGVPSEIGDILDRVTGRSGTHQK